MTENPTSPGRVVVLAGGLSHERDVSLRSGRRVAEALRSVGLEVEERDVDSSLLPALLASKPACVVPMLHGETGEDGAIREVLDLLGIPYVGASPEACRIAFDKPVAKTAATRADIRTPESVCLPAESFRELGAPAVMDLIVERLGLPIMVKPTRSGSALGCSVVRSAEELPAAMVSAYAYGTVALLEQFVEGVEVAVPVVDTGAGAEALPVVEIRPESGVYDFTARYTAGSTTFVTPAELSPETTAECQRVALAVHEAFGLRDLSRSDLIVDAEGQVWFLEVNVAPGFTETSIVPLAVQSQGADLGKLISAVITNVVATASQR